MRGLDYYKDEIAKERGYDSWNDMYDWVCRDGEIPVVVGQIIECYTRQAISLFVQALETEELKSIEGSGQIAVQCRFTVESFSKNVTDALK